MFIFSYGYYILNFNIFFRSLLSGYLHSGLRFNIIMPSTHTYPPHMHNKKEPFWLLLILYEFCLFVNLNIDNLASYFNRECFSIVCFTILPSRKVKFTWHDSIWLVVWIPFSIWNNFICMLLDIIEQLRTDFISDCGLNGFFLDVWLI